MGFFSWLLCFILEKLFSNVTEAAAEKKQAKNVCMCIYIYIFFYLEANEERWIGMHWVRSVIIYDIPWKPVKKLKQGQSSIPIYTTS